MRRAAGAAAAMLAALSLYFMAVYIHMPEADKTLSEPKSAQTAAPEAVQTAAPESTPEAQPKPTIIPTTIDGGMVIKNRTGYDVDINAVLAEGAPFKLPAGQPQILIIHTHSSEAYDPAGLDKYEDLGTNRTLDRNLNVIRVGEELANIFRDCGLEVIHDTQVFDYPSYTGSYTRAAAAIEQHLKQNPSIKMVIDLHRDALCSDTVTYKTVAQEKGICASQIMMIIGTDEYGLEHPHWRDNLRLAVYIQNAVCQRAPSLMRPIVLTKYRYNQQLTPGSMILEVGCNGNTLQEALAAIRLFGSAAGPALAELIE